MSDVTISAQITPNPNTLKFVLNKILMNTGSIDFNTPDKAKGSPLVEKLYAIDGVVGVLIGTNFVSISKTTTIDWAHVAQPITDVLKTVLSTEGPYLDDAVLASRHSDSVSEIEQKIKDILDTEIRPAVAMDGGDVVFYGYDNGIVSLHLQGACSTCPSATLTLKLGIENRLKQEFPEIQEVIQV